MKIELKIPALGESINEAVIGKILKPTGSYVKTDDEILELETDKVNQVLYSPADGQLTLLVKEEEKVRIGTVIGTVDTEIGGSFKQEDVKAVREEEKKTEPPAETEFKPGVEKEKQRFKQESFVQELKSNESSKQSNKPEKALEKEIERVPPQKDEREKRKKMTKIRQIIGKRLVDALHHSAMLTTFNEVDMSEVNDLRSKYKDKYLKTYNVKLGFMSFFVKAVVDGLKLYPTLNAYIDGDEVVQRLYYDIGVAVSTEKGLLVPVLKNCDQLSFAEIEQEIITYSTKAREGRLSLADLEGGGFTITNGGVFGSLLSTPIINPPQCGILGMHAIKKRAVVVNDEIVIRPMMYLALSYDHRLIDGREAVSFLIHIKEVLEDPSRLMFIPEKE